MWILAFDCASLSSRQIIFFPPDYLLFLWSDFCFPPSFFWVRILEHCILRRRAQNSSSSRYFGLQKEIDNRPQPKDEN